MLKSLRIKGLAIIKDLDVEFSNGFNVFTGETGAGKTLIVSGIGLLKGEKVPRSFRGRRIEVIGVLKDVNKDVKEYLKEKGFYDEEIIMRRVIDEDGNSKCFINDTPCKLGTIKEIGDLIFEITTQNQTLIFSDIQNHRRIIDSFAGISKEVEYLSKIYFRILEIKRKIKNFEEGMQGIDDGIKRIQSEIKEIEEAGIRKGEEEEIRKRIDAVEKVKRKREVINEIKNHLYESESSLYDVLSKLCLELEEIGGVKDAVKRIKKILVEIEDVNSILGNIKDEFDLTDEEIKQLYERIDHIYSLKYKYGEDPYEYKRRRERELKELLSKKQEYDKMKDNLKRLEKEIKEKADSIHKERIKAKKVFEKNVKEELKSIGMKDVEFLVNIEKRELASTGYDRIEFYIRTVLGEEPKPLREIASGGEKSRILLSIRNAIRGELTRVIIFDEIDQGLSFAAGEKVGRKLKELSRKSQVIAITHLASIGIFADVHFSVRKVKKEKGIEVEVFKLKREERLREFGRMMFGKYDEDVKKQVLKLFKEVS
ncbi:MAG: hypothetical protein DRI22_03055 [Caldiserica bacterium]|nr:MAG: hypothetical protein DRI22_03055 [Caldisericota bacterium]